MTKKCDKINKRMNKCACQMYNLAEIFGYRVVALPSTEQTAEIIETVASEAGHDFEKKKYVLTHAT